MAKVDWAYENDRLGGWPIDGTELVNFSRLVTALNDLNSRLEELEIDKALMPAPSDEFLLLPWSELEISRYHWVRHTHTKAVVPVWVEHDTDKPFDRVFLFPGGDAYSAAGMADRYTYVGVVEPPDVD